MNCGCKFPIVPARSFVHQTGDLTTVPIKKRYAKEYKNVLMMSMIVITVSANLRLFFHYRKTLLLNTLQYVMMASVLMMIWISLEFLLESA